MNLHLGPHSKESSLCAGLVKAVMCALKKRMPRIAELYEYAKSSRSKSKGMNRALSACSAGTLYSTIKNNSIV